MFCPNCGAKIPDDSIFCEECGSRIEGDSFGEQKSERAYSDSYEQPQPVGSKYEEEGTGEMSVPISEFDDRKANSKTIGYIIVGIAVVAVIVTGIFFFVKGRDNYKSEADSDLITEQVEDTEEKSGEQTDVDTAKTQTEEAGQADAFEAEVLQGSEKTEVSETSEEDMDALAKKFSTTETAMAGDFEWALDYVLYDGDEAGIVISDPSRATRITKDMQPLLNGGWKAFMFTKTGDYGSDVERYLNAEINTSGDDFSIKVNWGHLYDPGNGTSYEESGSGSFDGTFDISDGTATALTNDAKIEFDSFYISSDRKTEYALGKFYWISGEIDQIALMRKATGGSSETTQTSLSGEISLDDFDWLFAGTIPTNGTPLSNIQDIGGNWRSLLRIKASSDRKEIYRLMLSDAEIQYMGYKVTVLFNVKECYECPVDDRSNLTEVETGNSIVLTMNGDWNEETGYIDAESVNSTLAIQIRDHMDVDGIQYAFGSVLNGDNEIGEIALMRAVNQ